MVTAIVRAAKEKLIAAKANGVVGVECGIVFPVSVDAITQVAEDESSGELGGALGALRIIPGPAAGEGCSTDGGCASCPYMKMNSLDALMSVLDKIGTKTGAALLTPFEPKKYSAAADDAKSIAALGKYFPITTFSRLIAHARLTLSLFISGCVPILHMRDFTRDKAFSDAFVADITERAARR